MEEFKEIWGEHMNFDVSLSSWKYVYKIWNSIGRLSRDEWSFFKESASSACAYVAYLVPFFKWIC